MPDGGWYGLGSWMADKHGPPATFVDSLGLGNALVGGGLHLEAGWRRDRWDLAGKVLLIRDPQGQAFATFYQGHALRRSAGGWLAGLEMEPLVWGFGLNGGYLLGEAARPFPRFRIVTPPKAISLFGLPMGTWRGQFFLGRIEGPKTVGENSQDPSYRLRRIAEMGDPQHPFISGIRAEAKLGESTELYLNYINLFGGTLNGRSLLEGYGTGDYLTALFGLKDTLAEGNIDFNDPNHPAPELKNKAQSASNSDVGIRIRLQSLASLLKAEDARIYITRGSKAVNLRQGHFFRRPFYYLGRDLDTDWKNLTHLRVGTTWNQKDRYVLPSPEAPNDTVGMLARWEKWRLGLEYLDTVNEGDLPDRPLEQNHRAFEHGIYLSGFYAYGDPLGEAMGGEARFWTLTVQHDGPGSLGVQTWVHLGSRPFREDLDSWHLDHPGLVPEINRFVGIQQTVQWQASPTLSVRAGGSYQHQSAQHYVPGASGHGFRWFLDMSWHWSVR